MKPDKIRKRKDMRDLRADIMDTANTSKEIAQNKFRDAKKGTRYTLHTVDENTKGVVKKVQDTATHLKSGSLDVAHSVKKTATNVARTVTASNEKT